MRLPFNGDYQINQAFNDSCCRASYAQYGMNGHNGIDYALPSGTPVIAVRSGSLYRGWEPGGYGNYLFLTDDSGNQFVYGHLMNSSDASRVNEGDVIGHSDNTGNSSGPHLHFGYRPKGYNPSNGFLGYTDPSALFSENKPKEVNMAEILDQDRVDRLFHEMLDRAPSQDDLNAWKGHPTWDLITAIITSSEHDKVLASRKSSEYVEVTDKLYRKK